MTSPYAPPAEVAEPRASLRGSVPPSRPWKAVAIVSFCAALVAFVARMGYPQWMTPTWLFYVLPALSLFAIIAGTAALVAILRRHNKIEHWPRLLCLPLANIFIAVFFVGVCLVAYLVDKMLVYSWQIPVAALVLSALCAYFSTYDITPPKTGRLWAIAAVAIGFFQFVIYVVDRFFL